jgi:hypothetical protein
MLLLGLAAQGRAELPHTTLLPSSPSSYFGQVESVGTGGGILMPLNLSVSNLVEDHRMAEVFRESSKCFNETEGLGGGGYGDCGKAYDWAGGFTAEESDCSREVGYGCWFFLAQGTGIFVNVGRSLRVHNRCAAHKALGIARMTANSAVRYLNGSTTYNPKTKKNETQEERLTFEMHEAALPCTTGKVLDGRPCEDYKKALELQTRLRDLHSMVEAQYADPWCDQAPGDRLYCERAQKLGYDSIQIAQSHGVHQPELVMCTGKCMTEPVTGACTPLDLREANGAFCNCSEHHGAVNCGKDTSGALSTDLWELFDSNMLDKDGCNRMLLGRDFGNPLRKQALCEHVPIDPETGREEFGTGLEGNGTILLPQWMGLPTPHSMLAKFWNRACENGQFPAGTCRKVCVSKRAKPPPEVIESTVDHFAGILMPLNISTDHLVADDGMAEVYRENSACMGLMEGYGGGLADDCGEPYELAGGFTDEEASCSRKVGYGCWFHVAKGTQIFVNVGKSLRVKNRCGAHKALGISEGATPGDLTCESPGVRPGERLYCERARDLGYDSIQIAQTHQSSVPTLVICSGKCMTEPVKRACPPLDLQDKENKTCACEDRAGVMTCGNMSTSPLYLRLLERSKGAGRRLIDQRGCNVLNLPTDYNNPLRRQALCPHETMDRNTGQVELQLSSAAVFASGGHKMLMPAGATTMDLWTRLPIMSSHLVRVWNEGCNNGFYPKGACIRMCVSESALPPEEDEL